ncbi:MAG: DMT family transporter, partial [Patescibacteria group bacterium]
MENKQKQERIGELFIFGEVITFATFPIIINYATRLMPPVFFAAISTLLAGLCLLPYLIFTKQIRAIFERRTIELVLGIAIFIVIIPSVFIFIGTSKTSSINTTLLLQTELLFTFIICGLFFGEKITKQKILGGLAVIIGATIIL